MISEGGRGRWRYLCLMLLAFYHPDPIPGCNGGT